MKSLKLLKNSTKTGNRTHQQLASKTVRKQSTGGFHANEPVKDDDRTFNRNQISQFNLPPNHQKSNQQDCLIAFKPIAFSCVDQMTKATELLISSQQPMENLNGIFSQEEDMHLLSEIFGCDGQFSSKLIDSKNKIDSDQNGVYLNGDDELRYNLENPLDSFSDLAMLDQNNNLFSTTTNHSPSDAKLANIPLLQFNQQANAAKSIKTKQQNVYKNYQSNHNPNSIAEPSDQTIQSGKPISSHLSKQNRKKLKNLISHPKKKTIKFHEYKGPTSIQKQLRLGDLENGPERVKEQQVCLLHKQLLNQINPTVSKAKNKKKTILKN